MHLEVRRIKILESEDIDFEIGFYCLFEFIANNPNSKTAKEFIKYHINTMNNPVLENGEPDLTYLFGKELIIEEWVHESEQEKFKKESLID